MKFHFKNLTDENKPALVNAFHRLAITQPTTLVAYKHYSEKGKCELRELYKAFKDRDFVGLEALEFVTVQS